MPHYPQTPGYPRTDAVEELSAAAVLQEQVLRGPLPPVSVEPDDILVAQHLVDADFLLDVLRALGRTLHVHDFDGHGLLGAAVHGQLHPAVCWGQWGHGGHGTGREWPWKCFPQRQVAGKKWGENAAYGDGQQAGNTASGDKERAGNGRNAAPRDRECRHRQEHHGHAEGHPAVKGGDGQAGRT